MHGLFVLIHARMEDVVERWEAAVVAGDASLAAALYSETGALTALAREADEQLLEHRWREMQIRWPVAP